MSILGLDIGSSSVKAAVLKGGRVLGEIVHASFPSSREGVKVEVDPEQIIGAVAGAIKQLGKNAKTVDSIGLSVMSPAWIAIDKHGKPLTPAITHQDRRSIDNARQLEKRVGKKRYLKLAGNLPFPGGISATTFAWFKQHHPGLIRKADLVGHLNTFLHCRITGARVIDPANASFTGLYLTCTQGGWSDELCEAAGVLKSQLPNVAEANQIGGTVTASAARALGLKSGTPMYVGIVDTSSAMLLAGARSGQLLNVSGSTDVLAVCTDKAMPNENLLTRALGVGRKWMSVSTIAAAGSTLNWSHSQLFSDLTTRAFFALVDRLAVKPARSEVRFEPYLAGSRTSIEQRQGAFTGLTLATTREQLLSAIIEALAAASAQRLPLLAQTGAPIRHDVMLSGGVQGGLAKVLHRDWPGKWKFTAVNEATLRGLATLGSDQLSVVSSR